HVAVRQHLAHAFFDGGDVLVRNHPAPDLIDELEAGATRERLHPQIDLPELPGAAGLFLVAGMPPRVWPDRFAVRYPARAGRDLQLGLDRHPLQPRAKAALGPPPPPGLDRAP